MASVTMIAVLVTCKPCILANCHVIGGLYTSLAAAECGQLTQVLTVVVSIFVEREGDSGCDRPIY